MKDVGSKSSVEAAHDRQLPSELLQKLHDATEKFHQAKKTLEAALGGSEQGHQKTIDNAADELRTAERELEEVTGQIHGSLRPPPPVEPVT